MNSQILVAAIKSIISASIFDCDVLVVSKAQVYFFEFKKKVTVLIVFIEGHQKKKNLGHFVLLFVRRNGTTFRNFEFFDPAGQPLEFYFEDFFYNATTISHAPFQNQSDKTCCVLILYFTAIRVFYSFRQCIRVFNQMRDACTLLANATAHFRHVSQDFVVRPTRETIYYPMKLKSVLSFLTKKCKNG